MNSSFLSTDSHSGFVIDALPKVRIADDMVMLRAASELTRDLNAPKPSVYWADFLASAGIGYAALFGAIFASSIGLASNYFGARALSCWQLYS
jgi:hypothetical protein